MSLGIAVIGLGRWGPNHVRTFASLHDCAVVATADPDEKARARLKGNYPGIECLDDYRRVLERHDVDAVVVATPVATHHEIVTAALQAGKHVLCEKPIAHSSEAAWDMEAQAREHGLHLMVGHVFLFNPGIEYLCSAAQEDSTGPIYYLSAIRTNLGPFRYDVNAAWDLASHDINTFNAIVGGRPHGVSAVGAGYVQPPLEDIVFMTLHYDSNIIGHIHVSWLDPKKVRQITMVSEQKMITWDEFGVPGSVMIYDRSVVRDPHYATFGEFQLLTREGDVTVPRIPPREPLVQQARAFVDLLQGRRSPANCGARHGAEVVDVLEAASRSLLDGGRRCEVTYGR